MIQKQDLCETGMCRPGGFLITDQAIEFCVFDPGAKVIDVGCGLGATVLHARSKYKLDAYGVDLFTNAPNCVKGDAHCLPFPGGYAQGVMFECSFNKMSHPGNVLDEAFRVLKSRGKLIISDFYLDEAQNDQPLGRFSSVSPVGTRDSFSKCLEEHGFSLLLFEDYTRNMKQLWGQMIFTYGAKTVREQFGYLGKCSSPKLGYGLFVAQRTGE